MEPSELEPIAHLRDDGLQLSYTFPHRVYDAKVHPIQAPNGSTVIIYAHETGLNILWRGGKHIKAYEEVYTDTEDEYEANGKGDDVVMIIDSDEEDTPAKLENAKAPTVQYEEDLGEMDSRHPYVNIIETFNIHLGIKVLKLGTPSILPSATQQPGSLPPALSKTIIFTASCVDSSVRVIALPLAPPPPPDSPYAWDFQSITIPAQHVEVIPKTVSMTFTREKTDVDIERRGNSRRGPSRRTAEVWKLILAVHSAEAAGKLSIYRIGLKEQAAEAPCPYLLSEKDLVPIQQLYLSSPAKVVSFHPSQYPSDRHTYLLLAYEKGTIELYSLLPLKTRNTGRRSIPETQELQLKMFFVLHTEFDTSSANILFRKRIVDAIWVLGGRAVLVLTTDGEWGLWDIDASGPDGKVPSNNMNISLSHLTKFALSGRVTSPEGSSKSKAAAKASISNQNKTKFAPMTPSTRRIREETLFKGNPDIDSDLGHSYRGGISNIPTPGRWDEPVDESILIWHDDKNLHIPSLRNFWKNSIDSSTTVSDLSNRHKPALIRDVRMLGELENAICYIPSFQRDTRPDILIAAESRILLLTTKLVLPDLKQAEEETAISHIAQELDQHMLDRGELDLDGMDRMLAGMANGTNNSRPNLLRSSQNTFFA